MGYKNGRLPQWGWWSASPAWKVTSDVTTAWEDVSLFFNVTGKSHNFMLMRDERRSTGCSLLVNREMTTTRMTARWDGIRTARWCSVNPRLACSWHLYLLHSRTRGCRKPTLLSCCRMAARMSPFWLTFPAVWEKKDGEKIGKHSERACFLV